MSRLRYVVLTIGCVAFSALMLTSCKLPSPSSSSKGSLQIVLSNSINAKTLVPPIDMNAASYTVTGTGPNGASFTATSTGGTVTENSLAFGTWTIVVNALNAEGQFIGTGTASAQINTGETTTVTVNVTPVSGTGTLSLTVSWPASQVQTPSINATLTPALGTAQNLPFVISGSTATYSNASVGNGYYTLTFTLADNAIVVAGAVDVVRIVTGQTTSGSYTFTNVNAPGGTLQVNINANMQNPLLVNISGGQSTQNVGTTQTLTASVSNYSGNVVYVWYVNGVSQATGSSFTFGTGVAAGYYRIDVTAFSADGTQAGSATQAVQVIGTTTASVYAGGWSNNSSGVMVAGYWLNGSWVGLANPYGSSYNGTVCSLVVSGSNVYAGGYSNNSSNVPVAGYWLNGTWVGLSSLYWSSVTSLVVSGSNVYAGGYSNNSSNVQVAGYWLNGTWVGLTNTYGSSYGADVGSLVVSGSNVYAGGVSFNSSGMVAGYWLNGSWVGLANPYGSSFSAEVCSVVVSGSNVYAGGYSSNSSGVAVTGYWLNGSWVGLANPYGSSYNGTVCSLVVSGSNVYAGGYSFNSSGVGVAGYWLNGTWVGLTNPYGSSDSYVCSLVVSGSNVYAGGYCNGPGVRVAGYWLNGSWVGLTNPYGSSYSAVASLALTAQ